MGKYLGYIRNKRYDQTSKSYVNFKPLYEYVNGEFIYISTQDRKILLPESKYEDIYLYGLYGEDQIAPEEIFVDDEYLLIDFEVEQLEDNIHPVTGQRNYTGYKMDVSKYTILSLSDIGYYYILDQDAYDGDYKVNPVLAITDTYVYQGLQVVIQTDDKSVLGPFTVEYQEDKDSYVVFTNLQLQKYVLSGYYFSNGLKTDKLELGKYEDKRNFLRIGENNCTKKFFDFVPKKDLLIAFRETLDSKYFFDGKLDLSNVRELVSEQVTSLFIGEGLPAEIVSNRQEIISTLLTNEAELNDTFSFISETIAGILLKYQDSELYQNLVQSLSTNPDFMAKIPVFQSIAKRIESKQTELETLTKQIQETKSQIDESKKNQALSLFTSAQDESEISSLQARKRKLELDIQGYESQLEKLKRQVYLGTSLVDLESRVKYKEGQLSSLENEMRRVLDDSTETAMRLNFDGMLSNMMIRKAAEWENAQTRFSYETKISDLIEKVSVCTKTGEDLINHIVSKIQEYRPNYDKNAILNILICYTQGFLTVFSGEPGTGKTSICEILANVLGLNIPKTYLEYEDGYDPARFVNISVERGWTTKRDFIGYYNPLTKTFDRNNRRMFDALNLMDLETKKKTIDMPFMILLDEANLSPMEYYWADYLRFCDKIDDNSYINLGGDYCYYIPQYLRFLATINNDHTTESLSPRLIDRAWIIRLPKVRPNRSDVSVCDINEIISWSSLDATFGAEDSNIVSMNEKVKDIYEELIEKCRSARIMISPRVDKAIRSYWSVAQRIFVSTAYDSSIIALDYAVAQRIIPHINGSGEQYGEQLTQLKEFCSKCNLKNSADLLSEIIQVGKESMHYYQFFA
ncbi:MAG: hypothetical protein IJD59_04135 [Clostridia bacterium]|nr:hypothetical protein [Clostridia bacterium]